MVKVIELGYEAIADHSFSTDKSLLAIARSRDAELYFNTGSKYQLGTKLSAHDKVVTAVDISPQGQVVTCSQDRNAYVWDALSDGTWRHTLVLLRLNRAATSARWNPQGTKFAVGSADRAVAVCYYESDNDWWVAKHIKKPIRSTILCTEWHPNGVLLAAGGTDGHARVFSGYIKAVDEKPAPTVWGERLPFNTLCADFADEAQAWVHAAAFSPSGDALAWTTHDSQVFVSYGPDSLISIDTTFLPFHGIVFTNESQLVAAGYDCHPVVFSGDSSSWSFEKSVDNETREEVEEEQSALKMFKQMDLKGTTTDKSSLPTIHQNAIRTVRLVDGQVTTSGDAKVVTFDV